MNVFVCILLHIVYTEIYLTKHVQHCFCVCIISHSLDSSNIFEFPIKWERGKGLDPDSCPPHEDYLIQMCERVCHTLQEHISHAADIVHMQTCNATYQEVLVHSTHCQKIAQTYMVR